MAIEVELPVCPHCDLTGKIPRNGAEGRAIDFYCTGPREHRHKRTKMEYRTFREVPDGG